METKYVRSCVQRIDRQMSELIEVESVLLQSLLRRLKPMPLKVEVPEQLKAASLNLVDSIVETIFRFEKEPLLDTVFLEEFHLKIVSIHLQ